MSDGMLQNDCLMIEIRRIHLVKVDVKFSWKLPNDDFVLERCFRMETNES